MTNDRDPPSTGRDVARLLGAELGGASRAVGRLTDPAEASIDAVVVVSGPADLARLADRDVGVLVGPPDLSPGDRPYVAVEAPRLALARLSARFDTRPRPQGIAATAAVDPNAHLGADVAIGPGAVVHAGARIGDRTAIGAGCVIGPGSTVGADCRLHATVTLYDGVGIGDRVVLHSGVVLGADGFGYAAGPGGAVKIHHLGGVWIGDDVEIGANTCIDRGTLGDTTVGDRTKIDNLCQIGHNVSIGADTLIAGLAGIGGSSRIGRGVTLAGRVSVADHVSIGDGATVGGGSGVHKDIPAGETWMGPLAVPYRQFARLRYLQGKLEDIWTFVKDRS